MAEYENKGRSADEAYQVQQRAGGNFAIDPAQLRAKAMSKNGRLDGAAADSYAMEQADNEDARKAYRVVQESGGLSMADLMEGLSPNDFREGEAPMSRQEMARLAKIMDQGLNDGTQRVARELIQDAHMQDFPDEASMMSESMSANSYKDDGDWITEQRAAKLRSGKTVPVWFVVNESTGMKIEKPFRIQPPAERIATVLNITGNVNDPRIKQISEGYDEHVNLMKEIRKCRSYIVEGQTEYKRRLTSLQMKLEGVNSRLGI
jgi:hypothetical protein